MRSVNAVVGETNDGSLNDIHARRVTAKDVQAAIEAAKPMAASGQPPGSMALCALPETRGITLTVAASRRPGRCTVCRLHGAAPEEISHSTDARRKHSAG